MLPSGLRSFKYETDMAILRTKTQWCWLAMGLALLFTIPLYADDYWVSWLTRLAVIIIAVLGLHILTGLCGQISIGHAAFVAVGAYTVGVLTTEYGMNWWLCLPISGLAAGSVGFVFGLPSVRLKGFYLAMSTLAGHFVVIWFISYFVDITGGYSGMSVVAPTLGGIDFANTRAVYCLGMVLLILATYLVVNIQRTRTGRVFVAIRDNELAAQVGGVNLFRSKMLAFFIGCLFAGIAGWLWSASQWRLTPEQFRLDDSVMWIGMLIVGGMGSITGVFLGATFLKLLESLIDVVGPYVADLLPSGFMEAQFHIWASLIGLGLIIIAFLIWQPQGLYSLWNRFKSFYRLHPYSYRGT